MEHGFLFWVFFIGIIIATLQDLKRREVDNWLNFLIFYFGISFIVFLFIFTLNFSYLIQGLFVILLGFLFSNLFYYSHVFAGGDAKLLLALSPFFIGFSYLETGLNFFIFIFALFLFGGFYGIFYSFILYIKNFTKVNSSTKDFLIKIKFFWFILFGFILIPLSFFSTLFLIIGIFIILFPFLFSYAKAIEKEVLTRKISGNELKEGDWLVEDVLVGKKVIHASFEGISNEEIKILRKKKKIKIKEGIPFVPSFLFAFIFYYFYSDFFLNNLMKFFI